MAFKEFFSAQARQPSGWFGRWVMAFIFDRGNAMLNDLMVDKLEIRAGDRLMEIGFGTGKTIASIMADHKDVHVDGVDFSETMADIATRRNSKAIADGRVTLHAGDFSALQLAPDAYDTVFTCQTIYFWTEPIAVLGAIYDCLKPGGRLVIGYEDRASLAKKPLNPDVFRLYGQDDIVELMARSAFAGQDVSFAVAQNENLCCAVVHKAR